MPYSRSPDVPGAGRKIEEETARRLAEAEANGVQYTERGATWTYRTSDQPFGSQSERFLRGAMKKMKRTF